MTAIVVGGGKIGYYLAQTLLDHGHDAIIIEKDKKLCETVADNLDISVIRGDGTVIETLEKAGCDDADALLAVTGKDEVNLVACQLARKTFNIKKTIARVNNPRNSSVMKQLGVDIAISSTDNIARMLEREVDIKDINQIMSLDGEVNLSEIVIPANFKYDGKILMDLKIPDGVVIVTINRNGDIIIPRGNTKLCAKDKLIVIAKQDGLHLLVKHLGIYKH